MTIEVDVPIECQQRPCPKRARKIVRLKLVNGVSMLLCSDHTAEVLQRAADLLDRTQPKSASGNPVAPTTLDDVIQVDHLESRIKI